MKKLIFGIAVAMLAGVASASAQPFPNRPITVVVPFAAGGVTDIVARIVTDGIKNALGQSIVVENQGGAGGTIAVTRVHRAPADGYTLVVGQWTSHVGGGVMYPLNYDILNDFEPISMLSTGPLWIVGNKDIPANNIKELVAWLKANPTRGSTGTTGVGSGIHMCMLYFQKNTGTQFPMVPYRGAAPIMQDLISGQIDLSCPEAGQTLPQYRAGSIKAFGVLTQKRWFAAPDVPTLDESGFPGVVMPFWHALWAPKGTPKDVVEKLNAAVKESLADANVRKRFMDLGHEVAPVEQQTPRGLYAVHKAEIEKWWPIIKAANIKAE
ncbi:MAG: tripartite tricarboxylate transporter substrate-binding protein [Pseudomonadota bacterium]